MDVRSVDVIIKIGSGSTVAILGQRGAKLSSSREKTDYTVKTNYPDKVFLPGWNDASIDCDGLLQIGDGGFVEIWNQLMSEELVDIEFVIGDTGEQLSGKAVMTGLDCDAPQDKEPTFTCKLEKSGAWTPAQGS